MRGGYQTQADATRRIMAFVLLLTGVFLMIALYYVKTRAQTARKNVQALQYEIALQETAIDVLRAEIAHLENPERLQTLSAKYLGHEPTQTRQMMTLEDIETRFALRPEADSLAQEEEAEPLGGTAPK
jgi:hypothetical protein